MKDSGSAETMRQLYGQTAKYQVKYKKGIEAKYLTTLLPFPYKWALTPQLTAKKFAEIFYMKTELLSNEIRETGCTKKQISPDTLLWNISVLVCYELKHVCALDSDI